MNIFKKSLVGVDHYQQKHHVPGLIYAVIKKYSNDRGSSLTIHLTYTMFVTIFPLLLLLITILTLLLANDQHIRQMVLNSTFSQFPVVGSQLGNNIHVLKRDSVLGLIVGILGLIYGSTNLANGGMYVMEQVWSMPASKRPNFLRRLQRGAGFLVVLGLGLIITTALSGFGTFSRHVLWLSVIAEVLAIIVNVGLYLAAFKTLTPDKRVTIHDLMPGAIFGGISWTILLALGGYVVGHYLRNDNATYGVFGTVLGLIAWIYLGAEVSVYAAEINTVIKRQLWPRSLMKPRTPADEAAMSLQGRTNSLTANK